MGRQTAKTPDPQQQVGKNQQQQQQLSSDKSCGSPRGGGGVRAAGSMFTVEKLDLCQMRKSFTKSNSTDQSPRLHSVFSSNSVSNNSNNKTHNNSNLVISPRNSVQERSVSRQLDFSSPKSVTSKGLGQQIVISPQCKQLGLNVSPRQSESVASSLGNSQRLSETGDADSLAKYYTGGAVCIDELRQIENVLHASGPRLDELYKKVTETGFKDHASVFESLQWDILKETGYLSWFGLAFILAGFLSSHCREEVEDPHELVSTHWHALKAQTDSIIDQLDELNLCLETDSNIYKLVAGTLLYCCAVIRHLEQKPKKCMCFGSRPDGTWKLQIDSIICELKALQDNLNFAMLAAVGNRVAQPMLSPPTAVAPTMTTTNNKGPTVLPQEQQQWRQRQQLNPGTVGIDEHVTQIIDFIKKNGVCVVGIHGQSGLGKTTLLNEIVAKIENSEKRLFAYIEMTDDLRRLQSSLLLQLGGGKRDFQTTSHGRSAILYQLRKLKQQHKVVRIAIDNLSDVRFVGQLFPHSLGKVLPANSSILITCPSVAIANKVDQLCRTTISAYHYLPFKLPQLAPEHAKALFLFHVGAGSVHTSLPMEDDDTIFSKYGDLAEQFLLLCEGLPVALKVVGHYFSNSANCNEENWTAVAKRMKMVEEEMETSEDRMFAKLMVIFEKLSLGQKEAFLDIATFFQCWDWRIVERVVGKRQLGQLINQGLVHAKLRDIESISGIVQFTCYSEQPWKTEMVMMHDLLYAIACRRAHGNRVHSEDQAHLPDRLLMDSPGMELSQVQGLSLINCKEPLQGTMLEKMQDLRIIILHNIAIKGFCSKALNQVQFLYWGKSHVSQEVRLPFQIGKLRKLEMMILRAHEIDLLMKFPPQLKDLTIIGCNNMEELPETLLVLSTLLELHLISCNRLHDLTPAFSSLKMLRRFRLENCLSIQQLPKCIGALTNLYELDLSGCANLSMLSSEIGNLVSLNKLNLSYCKSLIRLPSEIGCLKNLTSLNLAHLMIMSLPVEIGHLRALEDLSLSGCAQLDKLPKEIGFLASLLRLNLSSCTALKELPKEIGKLISLQRLSLNSCSALSRLPDEFYELISLQSLDLDYCKLLAHLSPAICNLRSLQRLSLNCCTRLTWLPTEITTLPSIQVVNLVGCTGLKPEQPKEMQKITRENSRAAHKDHSDLVTLEGPKNRSFKLYSMTN